jgi:hypothetical protein
VFVDSNAESFSSSSVKEKIASILQVEVETVSMRVTPGSVILEVTVFANSVGEVRKVTDSILSNFGTAQTTSDLLGLVVLFVSKPIVFVPDSPPPSPSSPPPPKTFAPPPPPLLTKEEAVQGALLTFVVSISSVVICIIGVFAIAYRLATTRRTALNGVSVQATLPTTSSGTMPVRVRLPGKERMNKDNNLTLEQRIAMKGRV